MNSRLALALLPFAAALVGGCSDEDVAPPHASGSAGAGTGGSAAGGGGSGGAAPWADCDPLVPAHCGFPFPSDRYTVADDTTPTKKRVQFGATTLPAFWGKVLDPQLVADRDGFSAGQAPMTVMPGAAVTGLPTQDTIDRSLEADSPTILLDAETGQRIAHFSELDVSAASGDDDRALLVRPVVRLADGARYIVAIRNVVDAGGQPLEPSEAFRALRDGAPSNDASIEGRRTLYEDIFARLEGAGVARGDLQLAWDYTTSSRENNTSWLLHMRDDALAKVGEEGPPYVIDQVIDDPNPFIARRIVGRMSVPLYLDKPEAGGRLLIGDDGLPQQNEATPTAEYEFLVQVPHSAATGTPRPLLQNGHGLLGSKTEGQDGFLAELAEDKGYVLISVDLAGFAEDDEDVVVESLTGDLGVFRHVIDRQHQGLLNSLLAMRMMKGSFWKDPAVQFGGVSAIDPSQCYYRGDSQGGIFGTTYMALTTDVQRGLLGEPGLPYNLLLHRSTDFAPFFAVLRAGFDDSALDIQLGLGLVQMVWDRTEPNGWVPYVTDPLPGTPSHEVMLHVAIGDYQVTPLGAHIIARSTGARNLSPVNRSIWGVAEEASGFTGSSVVEFDFGLPESPKTNTPPDGPDDDDPHDKVRVLQASRDLTDVFLRTGVTQAACEGPCDPE